MGDERRRGGVHDGHAVRGAGTIERLGRVRTPFAALGHAPTLPHAQDAGHRRSVTPTKVARVTRLARHRHRGSGVWWSSGRRPDDPYGTRRPLPFLPERAEAGRRQADPRHAPGRNYSK
ncbi:hypothetical protein Mro03_81980 [Microbispora rosea subsp. rosea]|nr:hypothetical protein Mro03_81980 [Microbispora rosea subsp. rosea]